MTISLHDLKKLDTKKTFKLELLEEHNVYNEDLPTGRVYVVPDGNRYPSVTSFLSKISDKKDSDWYEKWVQKLGGQEAADAESARCAERGTGVHLALEYLVNNKADPNLAGDYKKMYYQLETLINMKVDRIRGNELALYSHAMKLAGRVDLIADYNGVLSIIDFKTSNNFKDPEWITNYFLQCTCYQIMLKEMYGLDAEQLVVLICVEKQDRPQVFIRDPKDFYVLLAEKIKQFRYLQEQEAKKQSETVSLFDMF